MSSPIANSPALLVRVERVHAVIAVLAITLTVLATARPVWTGVAAGTVLGGANLHLLGILTRRLVDRTTSSKGAAVGGLMIKLAVLAAAIAAVMFWLKPHPVALMGGLSLAPGLLVVVAFVAPPAPSTPAAEAASSEVGNTGGAS